MVDNRVGARYDDAKLVDATSKMIDKEMLLPNL